MMLKVGTNLDDDHIWREWRSVCTAGTNVDLRRARLLAEVLDLCGYTTGSGTTTPAVRSDEDTSGSEGA
jgi:hypothetical protein